MTYCFCFFVRDINVPLVRLLENSFTSCCTEATQPTIASFSVARFARRYCRQRSGYILKNFAGALDFLHLFSYSIRRNRSSVVHVNVDWRVCTVTYGFFFCVTAMCRSFAFSEHSFTSHPLAAAGRYSLPSTIIAFGQNTMLCRLLQIQQKNKKRMANSAETELYFDIPCIFIRKNRKNLRNNALTASDGHDKIPLVNHFSKLK